MAKQTKAQVEAELAALKAEHDALVDNVFNQTVAYGENNEACEQGQKDFIQAVTGLTAHQVSEKYHSLTSHTVTYVITAQIPKSEGTYLYGPGLESAIAEEIGVNYEDVKVTDYAGFEGVVTVTQA